MGTEVEADGAEQKTDPADHQMLMDIFGGSEDPGPAFERLRQTRPVAHIPELELWLVSRYDDCVTVIRDVERFGHMPTDMMSAVPDEVQPDLPDGYMVWYPALINTDPPLHTRIRKLAQKPITPRSVAKKEEYARKAANDLVDGFIDDGRVEFVEHFALALPILVLTHILGVPQQDVKKFERWIMHTTELFDPSISPERRVELAKDQIDFGKYVGDAIAKRREEPQDDLISELVNVEEEGEKKLTDEEIEGVVSQLILAGFDSTAGGICFSIANLCRDPELLERVRKDPDLIPTVVDETIRRSAPVRGVVRSAKVDVELGGETIPKGARVMALVNSANQDPEQFGCPHQFDIDRDPKERRSHIGFGQGVHKCIGQPIAQLDMRIAIETLLERLPNLRLATDELALSPGMIFLRPTEMVLEWDKP